MADHMIQTWLDMCAQRHVQYHWLGLMFENVPIWEKEEQEPFHVFRT
jgi:hypothetical protein